MNAICWLNVFTVECEINSNNLIRLFLLMFLVSTIDKHLDDVENRSINLFEFSVTDRKPASLLASEGT